ncbi:MAG: type II toxin-antitoxin system VapC family toxin [Lachnospiraceae bacterium]|nr:type II toxin-antitoxin system VapC family toxin [Lachnospiraceae bacterium]
MNILLDTHIAIWAISNHYSLAEKAKTLITDPDNAIYFSSVSVWEVLLKHDSPKSNLNLTPEDFVAYCEESGYYHLNMKSKHVLTAATLDISKIDKDQRDPFDRLLLTYPNSVSAILTTQTVVFFTALLPWSCEDRIDAGLVSLSPHNSIVL